MSAFIRGASLRAYPSWFCASEVNGAIGRRKMSANAAAIVVVSGASLMKRAKVLTATSRSRSRSMCGRIGATLRKQPAVATLQREPESRPEK
jgi:hypothetical protein